MTTNVDDLIAATIISYSDGIAQGTIDGYELFDLVYGPLLVELDEDGEWCVTGPEMFPTGVSGESVEDDGSIADLADLAAAMNLHPWSLAADYGWDDSPIDARAWAADHAAAYPAVLTAMETSDREWEEQKQAERDVIRESREEAELIEQEDREVRASDRGEILVYCDCKTREDAAEELGMPLDSETVRLYWEGRLDRVEAFRRAAKITHRHENTDYDSLLARGISKEDARQIIAD